MTAADQHASASFHVETTEAGMDEYLARHRAEHAKMAKLRALRLAAESLAPDVNRESLLGSDESVAKFLQQV
jgi:hypothetical protein